MPIRIGARTFPKPGMALAMVVLFLQGCGDAEEPPAPPAAPYRAVLDNKALMERILDPAADEIWGAAGSVVTEEGERSLAPTDDAGWTRVVNAAAVVAESGNLLMLPGRSLGDDWDELAGGLAVMGERAMAAAEARDEDAVFEVGGQLYNVCVACHQRYIVPESGAPAP